MIPYLELAALAVAALTVLAGLSALRWQARAHDRERQAWTAERRELVSTMAHLADRPLPDKGWAPTAEEDRAKRGRFLADPEQLP